VRCTTLLHDSSLSCPSELLSLDCELRDFAARLLVQLSKWVAVSPLCAARLLTQLWAVRCATSLYESSLSCPSELLSLHCELWPAWLRCTTPHSAVQVNCCLSTVCCATSLHNSSLSCSS